MLLDDQNAVIDTAGSPVETLVDPRFAREQPVARTLCTAAGLSMENRLLRAELRAQAAELRAAQARLVAAADAERRRLERDLHDGAQSRLVALALLLRSARSRAADPAQAATLDQAQEELQTSLAELRELARGIHPAVLSQRGLEPALEALA